LDEKETRNIARFLGISRSRFMGQFTRRIKGILSLTERPDGDCVFYEGARCRIQPVKPAQCRLYPFWFENLRSESAWRKTQAACPGVGEGRHVSPGEILACVNEDLSRRA